VSGDECVQIDEQCRSGERGVAGDLGLARARRGEDRCGYGEKRSQTHTRRTLGARAWFRPVG